MIQTERIQKLNDKSILEGDYILYWMQASVRSEYNHALEYSIELANKVKKPLFAFFGVTENFPEANLRHYYFLLEGLAEAEAGLKKRNIKLICRFCEPPEAVMEISAKACAVVCDRGYLRVQKQWRRHAAENIKCAVYQVESESIVPVNEASDKEEFAARTLRPKITKKLEKYLIAPPVNKVDISSIGMDIRAYFASGKGSAGGRERGREASSQKGGKYLSGKNNDVIDLSDIDALITKMRSIDRSVFRSPYFTGGEAAALTAMEDFIENRLDTYDTMRNDPALNHLSHLSPYLHFGHISPLKIALTVKNSKAPAEAKEKFLEELIVRRELSFNFCEYNPRYDSHGSLPGWAVQTLDGGGKDKRPYIYELTDFENARTHDHCWNAAQLQMIVSGKMHNYMRMYWGKKIIEWTPDFRTAYKTALYLNNKYNLDGRDPNSFAGVAWCFGKHDRPWTRRPIFGSIRYMNEAGLKRKFDMEAYIESIAKMCADNDYELDSLTHLMEK
jgi:deoxyribodipyrimidine photo-lyase